MIRSSVLVVDDEPLARRRAIRVLEMTDWVGRIEQAGDVDQARAAVARHRPDIMLLDIQLPGGTGFDLLENLGDAAPAVVFVTAFDHYALRAFEANAVDYVTKPLDPGRLRTALDRAHAAVEARSHSDRLEELQETVRTLRQALQERPSGASEFWIKTQKDYLRIGVDRVIRFQAERDYVRIHTAGAEYLHHESLASLQARLDSDQFLRIHRSAIVRRDAIQRLRPGPFSALIAVLSDGSEVRVGRTYLSGLRASLSSGLG